MVEHVICWDFDHTLFGFHPAPSGLHPARPDGEFAGFALRAGIEETLGRLMSLQYTSDITTSGSLAYVRRALEAIDAEGLLRHVAHVFTGDQIAAGAGKLYQPVAHAHGLSDEEASERTIVIGDSHDDEPADLASVVFVRQPNGHLRDPRVVEAVIGALHDAGGGHLFLGFQALHARARRAGQHVPLGGFLGMTMQTTAICFDERTPGPQRRKRLGSVLTPAVTLLEWGLLP